MKKLTQCLIFILLLLGMASGQSMAETIDVLIVYTPAALTKADTDDWLRVGVEAINAKIAFMVDEANQIFANSGIDHRLRLVARRMVNHVESEDLERELGRLNDLDFFNPPDLNNYNLELMSVSTIDDLPSGYKYEVVIAALVGTDLHIRIFNRAGKKVVDRAENELISGDNLTALKQLLNPFPDEFDLSPDETSEILGYVRLVAYPLNGHMDMVHTWRNEVGADVVNLITATAGGVIGGCAEGVTKNYAFFDYKGFFVNDLSFSYVQGLFLDRIGMLFTHELGHVLGCNHYQYETGPQKPFPPDRVYQPYAYAHKFWDCCPMFFGTVMATPELWSLSIPIKYFSNPDVKYVFTATGTSEANNAKVIKKTAPIVAGYRERVIPHGSIWVDTEWGGYENGSVSYPYNTVQEGIDQVASGGSIVFEHGSANWTGTINKPITITAGIGEMVIGQ
jgi:hypothetical protein